jgi:hypothetical protein
MAHFAKITETNEVLQVLTLDNSNMLNADGVEDETVGQQYLETHNKIFWHEKPYASWVKDITTASWKSPIGDAPALTDSQIAENTAGTHLWNYIWNETSYQADNTTGWDLTDSLV